MTKVEMIEQLHQFLRVASSDADTEIESLIDSGVRELELAGVHCDGFKDPAYRQAIFLYAKSHYGYDASSEKFLAAYQNLRDALALSGDYKGGD